jgi:hypothetical protein
MRYENIDIPDNYTTYKRIHLAAILLYLAFPAIVILDITMSLGNLIIFRIAGIPRLKRSNYIKPWSRLKIPNSNIWFKLGCVYCSYANGVAYFFRDVAMSVEFLMCPWKQKDRTKITHHRVFNDW